LSTFFNLQGDEQISLIFPMEFEHDRKIAVDPWISNHS